MIVDEDDCFWQPTKDTLPSFSNLRFAVRQAATDCDLVMFVAKDGSRAVVLKNRATACRLVSIPIPIPPGESHEC